MIKGDIDEIRSYYGGNATLLAIGEGEAANEFYDMINSQTDEENIRRRIRGRLINISNAQNVYIKGVTLANPPFWAIHMIYSDCITTNGADFQTRGYANSDGWDPDSSTNCTIFDCNFNTYDDCIAIKSGKNPEGNRVGRPSKNIKIIGCDCVGGYGIAVGGEMSGGVEGVYIRDCRISNSHYGIEFKTNEDRGGYIKDVHVSDSTVDQILIHSVTYNSDGDPAREIPVFSGFCFENLEVIGCYGQDSTWLDTAIQVSGFEALEEGDTSFADFTFRNIALGTENNIEQSIVLEHCKDIYFDDVKQIDGEIPEIIVEGAGNIVVDGSNII